MDFRDRRLRVTWVTSAERVQREVHGVGVENRAVLGDLDRVLRAAVVKSRLDVEDEAHRAAGYA
jgi:hypothetical protein